VEQLGNDPKSPGLQPGTYTMFATIPFGCLTDLETASPSSQEGILAFGRQTPFYFCDPGGIRTHGLPIKSRRLGPAQLRSHNLLNTKNPSSNELGSVSFIIFIFIKSLNLQKINTILYQYQVLIYC
jgi:hypothetical protein